MPLTRLTLDERIRLVRLFSLYEKSSTIQKVWANQFGTDPPSRKTIAALNKKFDETGSVADLTRSGRPKSSRTEEKIALVQSAIRDDPTKSIRILSNELGLNKASVHRIKQDTEKQSYLKQENKKLKEKINELQRRLDILEGRKPFNKKAKSKSINLKEETLENDTEHSRLPYVLSRTTGMSHYEPKLELVGVEQRQLGIGPSQTTVITVLTNDKFNQTLELTEGQEVHHLTIDANGHLREVEVGHEVLQESGDMLSEMSELRSVQDGSIESEMLDGQIISSDLIDQEDLISNEVETDEVILAPEKLEVVSAEDVSSEVLVHKMSEYDVVEGEDVEEIQEPAMEIPICFIATTNS